MVIDVDIIAQKLLTLYDYQEINFPYHVELRAMIMQPKIDYDTSSTKYDYKLSVLKTQNVTNITKESSKFLKSLNNFSIRTKNKYGVIEYADLVISFIYFIFLKKFLFFYYY